MPQAIILEPSLRWSGALRRKLLAHEDWEPRLVQAAASAVTPAVIQAWFGELGGRQAAGSPADALDIDVLRRSLRQLRQHVFFTVMLRDVNGLASFEEVVAAMSALADLAIGETYRSIANQLAGVHGIPRDPDSGRPQEMLILGMGKLGGRELNVSSDIDLIMLYGEEGETDGRRRLTHHEFYGRVTQRMMPVLSEMDANGQVFRTDLRLRPDGDSGPLAWSLAALENYLVAQGREWERYAWLKGRLIACQAFPDSDSSGQAQQLESLRTPFVYRKYFDFDALAALRGLRERIRLDWQRRALARHGVDTVHNIKLGDGGIREIEFVVQLSQLIRGGRMPSLRDPSLLGALHRQKAAGVLDETDADRLEQAYRFLRRVEHMLQYREDEQTHLLPRDPEAREALADAMGMEAAEFEAQLAAHRAFVSQIFRNAFRIAGMGGDDSGHQGAKPPADPPCANLNDHVHERLADHADALCQRIESLLDSHRIRSLPHSSRKRVEALLPAIVDAAARTDNPDKTAVRLFDLVEHIAQRSAYLALLAEYPETLARVTRIVSASPWASQYLAQYPLLLDSLIEWRSLLQPPDFDDIRRQLRQELDACRLPDGTPDVEQQMNLMRDTQHQVTFQLLAQDLEGVLTVERLADQLSALADLLLAETLNRVWPMVQRRRKPAGPGDAPMAGAPAAPLPSPRFAIIAYGKLGGKEIGYASDLDLVFLYDDPDEDAAEQYAKLARRMSSWLSTMTSSGRLYEIDLRLRPDGEAGLLAVPVEAFARYQLEHAWAWEHQAITRARYVAGDPEVGARFEQIRQEVLLRPRDPEALRQDVHAMRDKIRAGHPNRSGDFDLKHDPGGMVDVEFVTQYLVLSQSRHHPVFLQNLGNIALLRLAAEAGLIPAELAARVVEAYRVFRRRQHALRLEGADKARIPPDQLRDERRAVEALWNEVIG